MKLKNVALQLCTCIWIEIMTCVGITLYLLYLGSYNLAAITVAVFSPLIGFHFAIDKLGSDRIGLQSRSKLTRNRHNRQFA
jgi:hypothetical protein